MPTLHQPPADAELDEQLDRVTAQIIKDIEVFGWAITSVAPDPEVSSSSFSFSTGFTLTLGVPEVVVCGYHYLSSSLLLNVLGMRLLRMPLDDRLRIIADGATMHDPFCAQREIAFRSLGTYREAGCLHMATNVLGHDFPIVQLLLPDRDNHLPTSPECDPAVARCQAWPPCRD